MNQPYVTDHPRKEVVCVSGTVKFEPKRGKNGRYVVWFYNPETKRSEPIRRNTNGDFLYSKKMAKRLLNIIQGDYERRHVVPFKLSKYKDTGGTNVVNFINFYIEHGMNHMSLGGKKTAISRLRNWVIPFFKPIKVMLHEITIGRLIELANYPPLKFKTRKNILYDFKGCLEYAVVKEKIPYCPPMPKQKYYKKDKDITPEEDIIHTIPRWKQIDILGAIPVEHQPIFLWLMSQPGRRPGEAYALHKSSYIQDTDSFYIKYNISDRKLVEKPKNGRFVAKCSDTFRPLIARCLRTSGKFMFVNPNARRPEGRYSDDTANRIWLEACKKIGFTKLDENGKVIAGIELYNGVKHSTMDHYLNDLGLSETDLMCLTGHKSLQSIKRYVRMNLNRQGQLLSKELVSADLHLIIDNAAKYGDAPDSHQIVTKEVAAA
jgi:hypothetical protein